MTICTGPVQTARASGRHGVSDNDLTKTTREVAKLAPMQSAGNPLFAVPAVDGAIVGGEAHDAHAELNVLKEIVRLLPAGVTVQDEQGRFLLVNDAAAAQFRLPAEEMLAGLPSAP